jgi:DNA-binding NtrC family response regulator
VDERIGKFEAANGGTVFLDEIGDLPPMAQAKILRALQDKTIEHVGSHRPIDLDIRLIAATNVDLRRAVEQKTFREDLFYRLNVMPLHIPPLRERREDIPPLVRFYVERFCKDMKKPVLTIDDSVMEAYSRTPWRGNVRELMNAVERAVLLAESDRLPPHDETAVVDRHHPGNLDLEPALDLALSEKELMGCYAKLAYERFKRFDKTSELLGISFKTLKKRLEADLSARD